MATQAARKKPAPKVMFSQALFNDICRRIADGNSVRHICEQRGMPDRVTFLCWTKKTPELRMQYEQACGDGEDAICDDIQHIADTERDPRVAAVKIDARKWKLKIMNRRKYGDQVRNEHTGEAGGPLQIQIVRFGEGNGDDPATE